MVKDVGEGQHLERYSGVLLRTASDGARGDRVTRRITDLTAERTVGTAVGPMPLSYDRHAPEQMMQALLPGGFAHSLVEYGRTGLFALDLQLRGYANKPGHWATLYVGLTKVLDLHLSPKAGFKLSAHPTYTGNLDYGWKPSWSGSQGAENLAAQWPAVDEYLERAVTAVAKVAKFHVEGSVQSAISGFNRRDIVVIDREAVISFVGAPDKKTKPKRKRSPAPFSSPCLKRSKNRTGASGGRPRIPW